MPRLGLLKSRGIFLIGTKCVPAFSALFREEFVLKRVKENE